MPARSASPRDAGCEVWVPTRLRAGDVAGTKAENPRMTTVAGKRAARLLSRPALSLVAALAMGPAAFPASGDAQSRAFAAHALALRAAVVEGEGEVVLAQIPGGGPGEHRQLLWSPFFENAVVELGRLRTPVPVALYYNPLLDIALLSRWEMHEGGYRIMTIRALPGERLNDSSAAASPRPAWMTATSDAGPVATLAAVTVTRLDAFRRAHPVDASGRDRDGSTFAADADAAQPALARVRWNAGRRAHWNSGADLWLRPTLARIEQALSARDPASLMAVAPATDATTAEAISSLPAEHAALLVLDMVLDIGTDGRLLIGSSPGDGDIYFLVLCRLNGDTCPLHRVMMVSLSGWADSDSRSREEG